MPKANPLIIPILAFLKSSKNSCTLIDLVEICGDEFASIIQSDESSEIVLFSKNFFVMNALYQIQKDIRQEGYLLSIAPLDVKLLPVNDTQQSGSNEVFAGNEALADYYLDWHNLNTITVLEVDQLLSRFWNQYVGSDKVHHALVNLELEQGAEWAEIRAAYQRKVAICHPDKGGDAADFVRTREAYEVLKQFYRQVQ